MKCNHDIILILKNKQIEINSAHDKSPVSQRFPIKILIMITFNLEFYITYHISSLRGYS